MNKLVGAAVVVVASALPALSFAQSGQPLTRAQVRAELAELEQAGYNPAANDVNYPENLQKAQRRVEQQRIANGETSGYGAPAAGTSTSGR